MPIYVYKCPKCRKSHEMTHSMKECDTPSEETLLQITCKKHGVMKRVPQLPNLNGFMNGTSVPESTLLKAKSDNLKTRSRLHFKNEELENIKDPQSKAFFKKKYESDPKLKALKGDHTKPKKKY